KVIALPYATYLPAHGGPIADGPGYARALLAHRRRRNEQIVAAVAAGAQSIDGLMAILYPQLGRPLVPAARMVLDAHVEYLEQTGAIRVARVGESTRLSPAG